MGKPDVTKFSKISTFILFWIKPDYFLNYRGMMIHSQRNTLFHNIVKQNFTMAVVNGWMAVLQNCESHIKCVRIPHFSLKYKENWREKLKTVHFTLRLALNKPLHYV